METEKKANMITRSMREGPFWDWLSCSLSYIYYIHMVIFNRLRRGRTGSKPALPSYCCRLGWERSMASSRIPGKTTGRSCEGRW